MSSSVCQELQSCLVESRFLRLKLAPPRTNFPASAEPQSILSDEGKNTAINGCKFIDNQNIDMGGWSFLQSLANAKDSTQNDEVYVHPLVKSSASALSEKSLEMCTESLGSETGSEVSENSDDISLLSLENVVCNPSKPTESSVTRKMTHSNSFPPPLTSISGSIGVQVKSHREGGRLLLQAVTVPPCHSCFHAERSDGRLRLSLLKDATPISDHEDGEDEDQEEAEEEDEHGEEGSCWGDEDMEGNSGNVGDEIGTGKSWWGDEDMEGNSENVGDEIGTGKLTLLQIHLLLHVHLGDNLKNYKLEDFSQPLRDN